MSLQITAKTTIREIQEHDHVVDILNEYVDLTDFHPGDSLKRVCKKAGMAFSELRDQLNEALKAGPESWSEEQWSSSDDDEGDWDYNFGE